MGRGRLRAAALVAAAGVAVYFALFGGEYGMGELRSLDREAEELSQRLVALRGEVDSLRALAERLAKDPGTVERVARERYGMIRDGEILYRFVDRSRLDTPSGGR